MARKKKPEPITHSSHWMEAVYAASRREAELKDKANAAIAASLEATDAYKKALLNAANHASELTEQDNRTIRAVCEFHGVLK